jgi:hypothetical protein
LLGALCVWPGISKSFTPLKSFARKPCS